MKSFRFALYSTGEKSDVLEMESPAVSEDNRY
jgi:hypothetical protein